MKPRFARKAKDFTNLPDLFQLTAESVAFYKSRIKDGDHIAELERFLNWHRAKGTRYKDWQAAWRTWVLNQLKFTNSRRRDAQDEQEPAGERIMRLQREREEREQAYEKERTRIYETAGLDIDRPPWNTHKDFDYARALRRPPT